MKKSFLAIIIFVAASCGSDTPPEGILSESEMIDYLIDLHIAQASIQNFRLRTDSAKVYFDVKNKLILKEHGLTDSVFLNSYNYYLAHSEQLEAIYGAVVDSLSLKQSLLNEGRK